MKGFLLKNNFPPHPIIGWAAIFIPMSVNSDLIMYTQWGINHLLHLLYSLWQHSHGFLKLWKKGIIINDYI